MSLPTGQRVFLKKDRSKGWAEYLKYLVFSSRGKREFLIASELERKGLSIPKPLGWMERVRRGLIRESFYFSEAIGDGVSLIEDAAKSRTPRVIRELALAVKRFQEEGLFHRDLHGGNFLWEGDSLFLTDYHRSKIVRSLSWRRRLWNLSYLFHSLRATWGEEEHLQFLSHYFGERWNGSQPREILHQKIYPVMQRLQRRQWRSRTKRCLKESTDFAVQEEKGIRYFHRRDFPLDRLKKVMEAHRTLVRQRPLSLIKFSPEVIVSILDDGREKICVKQLCHPHFWGWMKDNFRGSKGRKAWVAANGIRARGLPSLKPLALAEGRKWFGSKETFLLMDAAASDQEMDRYVLKGFQGLDRKRLFIKTSARWLCGLHRMGLYHKDMKTCNILVFERGESWDFHLLDFEDVFLDKKVNRRKLFRNLLQLNTSTPKLMTKADRLRFFKEYLRCNPIVRDPKVFLGRLMEESRRRGLVYVSPQGVVKEAMR